jgi:hypothetical protein
MMPKTSVARLIITNPSHMSSPPRRQLQQGGSSDEWSDQQSLSCVTGAKPFHSPIAAVTFEPQCGITSRKAHCRQHLFASYHCKMSNINIYLNEYFTSQCPASAPFFSFMGAAIALVFASKSLFCLSPPFLLYFVFTDLGAAYGTAKAGVGIMTMGVLEPKLIIKSVIPVVMAGEFLF